jgi:hypothetical protein
MSAVRNLDNDHDMHNTTVGTTPQNAVPDSRRRLRTSNRRARASG